MFMPQMMFRLSCDYFLYALCSAVCLLQSTVLSVPGDSGVFYKAGLDLRSGVNPWLESTDSINFQFLNGPINSLFWGITSIFGMKANYILTSFLSIILVPFLLTTTAKFFQIDFTSSDIGVLSSLFICTFTFRSNIQYGQIVVIYVALFLFCLNRIRDEMSSSWIKILCALGLFCCLDFKPQIFILLPLLLRRNRLSYIFVGFSLGLMMQGLITFIVTGNPFPFDWLSRIFNRGSTENSHSGYYGLIALLHELGFSAQHSWMLLFIASIVFLFVLRFRKIDMKITLLSAFFIFSPFFHPQDFVLLTVIFLVVSQKDAMAWLPLGISIAWSTNLFISIFFLLVSALSVLRLMSQKFHRASMKYLLPLTIPQLAFMLASFLFSRPDTLRIFFNSTSVIFFAILLLSYTKSKTPVFTLA